MYKDNICQTQKNQISNNKSGEGENKSLRDPAVLTRPLSSDKHVSVSV